MTELLHHSKSVQCALAGSCCIGHSYGPWRVTGQSRTRPQQKTVCAVISAIDAAGMVQAPTDHTIIAAWQSMMSSV